MKCPICKKEVEPQGPFHPFCSERCRTIDLGNWAADKYRISEPATPAETEEDDEERKRNRP